ncbi:MAG TPA: ribosome maturation factor RimP [Candidatus Alectryocaccobium stercorigallinarum]|nr:ribosome maturation factor RimP [Candidatus Alectryocaccobium stercorigallinarum]
MGRRDEYESRAEKLILPIIEENGFELVDVEYVKEGSDWYLRAYIDKPGGININDCELVSRAFSDRLDEEDFIEDAYILEVSSPGLGRPIKKQKDFKRNLGKEIEFKSYKSINGKKEFSGVLEQFDEETFTVRTDNGEPAVYKIKDMAIIKEAVEW